MSKFYIKDHAKQLEIWNDPKRFKIVISGRRSGKSFLARELLLKKSDNPRSLNVYVAPTRQQSKDILWNSLKERLRELKWKAKINESELKITRSNGAIILLRSAESPDRLRGLGINFIIFDEFAEYKSPEIWTQVVRPALSDKRGEAVFIGTPKGFNFLYDLVQQSKTQDDWSYFNFKTIDSPFFQTPEGLKEIEYARNILSKNDFEQEYEAQFINFSGRIYYAYNRETCNSDYVFCRDNGPIYVGIDFNHSPMCGVLFQKIAGGSIAFDEIYLKYGDTESLCREIRRRYPIEPIITNPDATGARRQTSTSQTDFSIIQSYGFKLECGNVNPKRVDRWASTNRAFEKGLAKINAKKCPMFAKDLETLCYKEGHCEPDLKDPMIGHISDAGTYHIARYYNIIEPGKISVGYYV